MATENDRQKAVDKSKVYYVEMRRLNVYNSGGAEKIRILPPPQIPRVVHNVFAGLVTLTELNCSAGATYEANEATASVKFVASVKI